MTTDKKKQQRLRKVLHDKQYMQMAYQITFLRKKKRIWTIGTKETKVPLKKKKEKKKSS